MCDLFAVCHVSWMQLRELEYGPRLSLQARRTRLGVAVQPDAEESEAAPIGEHVT